MLVDKKKLAHLFIEIHNEKPAKDIIELQQVHGTNIIDVDHYSSTANQGDGFISYNLKNKKVLAIKTADCAPIFLQGDRGYAALHVGHKGLSLGILKNDILQKINTKSIYIGPCLHACCFEVQSDFFSSFPHSKNFFRKKEKIYFDFISEIKFQLNTFFPSVSIFHSPQCTKCDLMLMSHRRNPTNKERNYNIIF